MDDHAADPTRPLRRTDRTTPRRAERSAYDRALAYEILDEGAIAHVGISVDGQPFVVPMAYGRSGDELFLHGSVATRLARVMGEGAAVCVTVTLLDGLVAAKSQFHHSMNFRSIVVLGRARRLLDDEAERALERIVDHTLPGRCDETRPPNRVELRQTAVFAVMIDEASIKTRSGGPVDEPEDLDPDVWSGEIPLRLAALPAIPDTNTAPTAPLTASVAAALAKFA